MNIIALDQAATGSSSQSLISIGMIVLMLVFFYFFLYRPQKKQEKKANEMKSNLEIGDEITTIGGIIGEIVSVKGETITIETSKDRTKIRLLKESVKTVDVRANGDIPNEKTAPAPKKNKKLKDEIEKPEEKSKLNGEEENK